MSKPTRSKLDKELQKTQDRIAVAKIMERLRVERQVTRDTKLAKKLLVKTQKPRVLKPKPRRRNTEVEDEDDHKGDDQERP